MKAKVKKCALCGAEYLATPLVSKRSIAPEFRQVCGKCACRLHLRRTVIYVVGELTAAHKMVSSELADTTFPLWIEGLLSRAIELRDGLNAWFRAVGKDFHEEWKEEQ